MVSLLVPCCLGCPSKFLPFLLRRVVWAHQPTSKPTHWSFQTQLASPSESDSHILSLSCTYRGSSPASDSWSAPTRRPFLCLAIDTHHIGSAYRSDNQSWFSFHQGRKIPASFLSSLGHDPALRGQFQFLRCSMPVWILWDPWNTQIGWLAPSCGTSAALALHHHETWRRAQHHHQFVGLRITNSLAISCEVLCERWSQLGIIPDPKVYCHLCQAACVMLRVLPCSFDYRASLLREFVFESSLLLLALLWLYSSDSSTHAELAVREP